MACKYHPNAAIAGNCAECGNEFCQECSDTTLCLDCGAALGNRLIVRSYIAAGIGFVLGLIAGAQEGGVTILFAPILMAYAFWGTYLGWQYGGRVWPWLGKVVDKLTEKGGNARFIANIFFFFIRLTFSYFFGFFGGGIYAFIMCLRVKQKQAMLQSTVHSV